MFKDVEKKPCTCYPPVATSAFMTIDKDSLPFAIKTFSSSFEPEERLLTLRLFLTKNDLGILGSKEFETAQLLTYRGRLMSHSQCACTSIPTYNLK